MRHRQHRVPCRMSLTHAHPAKTTLLQRNESDVNVCQWPSTTLSASLALHPSILPHHIHMPCIHGNLFTLSRWFSQAFIHISREMWNTMFVGHRLVSTFEKCHAFNNKLVEKIQPAKAEQKQQQKKKQQQHYTHREPGYFATKLGCTVAYPLFSQSTLCLHQHRLHENSTFHMQIHSYSCNPKSMCVALVTRLSTFMSMSFSTLSLSRLLHIVHVSLWFRWLPIVLIHVLHNFLFAMRRMAQALP